MTVHVCVWICTRKLNLWLYSATGLTLKNAERGLWRENSPSWQSRSEEAQRRFVFVCTGESEACVQKAKQPRFVLTGAFAAVAWDGRGRARAEVKQPNSYISSSFLSLFLLSCLGGDGSRPATCIIKPFISTLLTDATSSLGWRNTVCFLNLWERLNYTAGWYMLGFVNVGLQLHGK